MHVALLVGLTGSPAFAQSIPEIKTPVADVKVYGTVVLNAVYNTGTVQPSQEAPFGAAMGSKIEDALTTDGSFAVSPRQSRLGVDAKRALSDAWTADSKIEIDFFGLHDNQGPLGTPHTGLRLRHAYVRVGTEHVRFTAGQLHTVVSPRAPTTLSHLAIALHTNSGYVWNRLPALIVDADQDVGTDAKLTGALAVARNHSGHGAGTVQRFDATDPGTRSELPVVQARVGLDTKPVKVGLAGHLGRETWDVVIGKDERPGPTYGEALYEEVHVPTWLASLDLKFDSPGVWVAGQGWLGQNVNGMFGRQGVRLDEYEEDVPKTDPRFGQVATVTPMQGMGGWAEVGMRIDPKYIDVVGSVAIDLGDPEEVDYSAVWFNSGVFGAIIVKPHEKLALSFEFLRNVTKYRPNDEYRTDEDYDRTTDPFRGEPLPLRMREGYNESFSLNVNYHF